MKASRAKIIARVVLALAAIAVPLWLEWRGLAGGYEIKDHDPVLEGLASQAKPAIAKLSEYHSKNGAYPKSNDVVAPWFAAPQLPGEKPGNLPLRWHYEPKADGKGYILACRLSWDPDLEYDFDGAQGKWMYQSGDGTPAKVLQLGP